jgi:hypothetical protein
VKQKEGGKQNKAKIPLRRDPMLFHLLSLPPSLSLTLLLFVIDVLLSPLPRRYAPPLKKLRHSTGPFKIDLRFPYRALQGEPLASLLSS